MRKSLKILLSITMLAICVLSAHADESTVSTTLSKSTYSEGVHAYQAGDYQKAIRIFQQAIGYYPNNAQAYSGLGATYQRIGMKDEAIDANKRAAEADEKRIQEGIPFRLIYQPMMESNINVKGSVGTAVWGWSQDGKVAFSRNHTPYYGDIEMIEVNIVDSFGGKVYWSGSAKVDTQADVEKIYQNFNEACIAVGIKIYDLGLDYKTYKDHTFDYNEQIFNIDLQTLRSLKHVSSGVGGNTIDSFEVEIKTQGKSKLVERVMDDIITDIEFIGTIINDKTALLIISESRCNIGYECDEFFINVDLSKGFKDLSAKKQSKPLAVFDKSFNVINMPAVLELVDRGDIISHPWDEVEEVSVWGWSKDGRKIAVTSYLSPYKSGTFYFNAYIFDLVDDSYVWQESLEGVRHNDEDGYYVPTSEMFSTAFATLYKKFGKACAANNIEFYQTEFQKFLSTNEVVSNEKYSFKHGGQLFNVTLDDEFWSGRLGGYKINVKTQGKSKLVSEAKLRLENVDDDDVTFGVYLQGYFISPRGDRAVLVLAVDTQAYARNRTSWQFIGVHLSSGFK